MKKLLIAGLLALVSASALATDYYVVVPMPNRPAASNIQVSMSSATLPGAVVGQPYAGFNFNSVLQVTGDPSFTGYGVKWSVISGSLPAGLTLGANGVLAGSPTAAGTANFQVQASYQNKAGQQAYQVISQAITVSLASVTPPTALVGAAYSYDLKSRVTVTGDSAYTGAGVTWAVVSSTLPPGLQLRQDGTISGTPTAAGTGILTAQATYRGSNAQQSYQVTAAAPVPNLQVTGAYAAPITGYYTLNTTYIGSASAALVVPLSNQGTGPGSLTLPAVTGANPGDFSATTTCSSVAPGANCEVDVVFTPTQTGSRYAALTVAGVPLKFTGTGQGTSNLQVTGNPATTQSFGTVTVGSASAAQSISLTNSGTAAGTLTVPAFTGANPGDFSSASTCSNVAPGANCQVSVTFQPTVTGTRSASLAIAGITYSVNGTGQAAASQTVVLTSGSSYTIPSGRKSILVYLVGAGGGGAGSTTADATSGGGGGAGGVTLQTLSVTPGGTLSLSIGAGGAGGYGAASGSAGGNTVVTYGSTTLIAYGGAGGVYNTGATAAGGNWSGGATGAIGGAGSGATGDEGGGGGGAIGGVSPAARTYNPTGVPGAAASYPNGLNSALTAAGQQLGSPGAGSAQGNSSTGNTNNGGAATGFGSGGGGAGYWGGNGGNGAYGGGGGGASGYTANVRGGAGGGGFIVIQLN